MSEHTDDVIIMQLRETVERQADELAELRRLVSPFGDGSSEIRWMTEYAAMAACRQYNKRKASQCPTSDT